MDEITVLKYKKNIYYSVKKYYKVFKSIPTTNTALKMTGL